MDVTTIATLLTPAQIEVAEEAKLFDLGFYDDWIAALENDHYEQTTGVLRKLWWDDSDDEPRERQSDRYCCLGVACDLYASVEDASWSGSYFLGYDTMLPPELMHKLGIGKDGSIDGGWIVPDDLNAELSIYGKHLRRHVFENGEEHPVIETLVEANDERRLSFRQIAALLRANRARVIASVEQRTHPKPSSPFVATWGDEIGFGPLTT